MEINLRIDNKLCMQVNINDQLSHTFDLRTLLPATGVPGQPPQPLVDLLAYGAALYTTLFPQSSCAAPALEQDLDNKDKRLLIVAHHPLLDTVD